jgi:hypothetical protein
MVEKVERRTDSRFQVDLLTEVTARGVDGEIFLEKTVLRNMSGGGASFLTTRGGRYYRGQQLNIRIDLPGTADVKACLEGSATVSRIDPLDSEPQGALRRHAVAVVIAAPLRFVRINGAVQKPVAELK